MSHAGSAGAMSRYSGSRFSSICGRTLRSCSHFKSCSTSRSSRLRTISNSSRVGGAAGGERGVAGAGGCVAGVARAGSVGGVAGVAGVAGAAARRAGAGTTSFPVFAGVSFSWARAGGRSSAAARIAVAVAQSDARRRASGRMDVTQDTAADTRRGSSLCDEPCYPGAVRRQASEASRLAKTSHAMTWPATPASA